MLPQSRNTNYAGGVPVKSVDLNDLQDCVVGTKSGELVLNVSPTVGVVTSGTAVFNVTPIRFSSTSGCIMLFPIPLRQGDRIKSLTFARKGDGVVDVTTCDVVKTTAAGASASINPGGMTVTINNVAAAWTDTTIDVTDTFLGAGESLALYVQPNQTGFEVGSIRVTYDRP